MTWLCGINRNNSNIIKKMRVKNLNDLMIYIIITNIM